MLKKTFFSVAHLTAIVAMDSSRQLKLFFPRCAMLDWVFGNFITYLEGTMEFVTSVHPSTLNKCVSYLYHWKYKLCECNSYKMVGYPFVEQTISISELLVSFITSEVEAIKSHIFPYISNHLECFSLQQSLLWLSPLQPFQTFSIMKPLCELGRIGGPWVILFFLGFQIPYYNYGYSNPHSKFWQFKTNLISA